jgi:hypothetical protein
VRTVVRSTDLDVPAARVWQAMLQPSTMLYVLKGLFAFPSLEGRFDALTEGERGTGWLLLFHAIPFAKWTIEIVRADPGTRTIVTNEHGGMFRSWNHTLHVDDLDANRSRYTDRIELDAGPLTGIAATTVGLIFSYRQRRLRRLARAPGRRDRRPAPIAAAQDGSGNSGHRRRGVPPTY